MVSQRLFRLAVAAIIGAAVVAFTPPSVAEGGVSYTDAVGLLLSHSDTLAGARAGVESQVHKANSYDYLDYPRVGIEAKALDSEKTVKVDLSGLKTEASTILPLLSSTYGAAIADEIPVHKVLGVHNSGVQSNVVATLPLYTGGKIPATQRAAQAGVKVADAELTVTEQTLRTQLSQVYFLYQLALRVREVRAEARDGLALHLKNAKRTEKAGVIAHAQTLQAQVAYDEAVRNLTQAEADVRSAGVALSNLLHLSSVPEAATPLFVSGKALPPLKAFLNAALEKHGQIARLNAMDDQAGEGVRIEGADRLPQVYLFGEYNIAGRNWDMTVPDWAFGLGVKYDLFSGIDRSEAEAAAAKKQEQVRATLRQTKIDLTTAVTRAYNDLSAAQEKFRLLQSSIASARENVRVQDAAFKNGMATSVDVVDARLALSRTEIDRAQAAYAFDEGLARLLYASGEAEAFGAYAANADRVIVK